MTPPPGSAGGLANAIFGSVVIVFVATFIQHADRHPRRHLPRRVRQGNGWIASATRFINDILLSAPSIVIGLFVYTIYVAEGEALLGLGGLVCARADRRFPWSCARPRTCCIWCPTRLREAAVALGAPMWKVILMVTLKAVRGGVITGILLAVARMSGETAPLLFTALNNQFCSADMNAPMANLPVVIFQFALSPYEDWKTLAWAGALLITLAGARHQHSRPLRVPAGLGSLGLIDCMNETALRVAARK